jgi:hypothetical protein
MPWSLLLSTLRRYMMPILIGVALAVLTASHGWAYSQGKQTERIKQEKQHLQAMLRAVEQANAIRDEDIRLLMESGYRETVIREVVRTVRVDVPASDCRDLGNDWVREANKAIAAASSGNPAGTVP